MHRDRRGTVRLRRPASVFKRSMRGKFGLCPQPGSDSVKDKPLAGTRQPSYEKLPISTDRTYGSGANSVAKPPTNAVAPTVPKVSYIVGVNNGSTDPTQHLTKLLLASTEAAMG